MCGAGAWTISLPLDDGLTFVEAATRSPWAWLSLGLGAAVLVALGCVSVVVGVQSARVLSMMGVPWLPASQPVPRSRPRRR